MASLLVITSWQLRRVRGSKLVCGIAGLIYRSTTSIGADLLSLIQPLESRGPDSAGIALYDHSPTAPLKLLLRGDSSTDWKAIAECLAQFVRVVNVQLIADVARISIEADGFNLKILRQQLRQAFPHLHWLSAGQTLEIYKDVHSVASLAAQYNLRQFAGTHGIAHTRMATESTVDLDHCHPFTSNYDLAIVHNGQISNYYRLRFQLERTGAVFVTENDSEAIAHYIDYQLLQGKTLEAALHKLLEDIDGTYTALVATPTQVGLVRDKFAAKPAVIYESPERVAIASEYRALLQLPDFDSQATIREPDAGEVNVWSVVAAPQLRHSVSAA